MKSKHIGVVILNYNTWIDTVECVQSFQAQIYDNLSIVIVDNGSSDQSVRELRKISSMFENVYLIQSNTNLGFAKGNNIGIRYARESLRCNSVIVINSDTVVQSTFVQEMSAAIEPGVSVISPYVVRRDGNVQPPAVNTDNIRKEIIRTIIMNCLSEILNSVVFRGIYGKYRERKRPKIKSLQTSIIPKKYFIQGCAYMLTEDFFQHYTQLYPNTFLYWEELNLLYYVCKCGTHTKYIYTSPVLHKVAVSTQNLLKNSNQKKQKRKLVWDSLLKSLPLYFTSYKGIKKKYC